MTGIDKCVARQHWYHCLATGLIVSGSCYQNWNL